MRPLDDDSLLYRLLMAVDIQGFSKRSVSEQTHAQRQLGAALESAATGTGLDRASWEKQAGGDGELATLPEGVSPESVAGDFVIAFAGAVAALNAERGGAPRLRVRLALHHGTMTPAGPFGPAGNAPIVVQRLLDSAGLRRTLDDDAARDVAYVVSDSLFDDVIRTGFCALPPAAFRKIRVTAKGAVFHGHVMTGPFERPGADAPPGPPVPPARVPGLAALTGR
ncbi:hypothetical protein [Actinomadura atramentaria]|uniref:hypothetical protein n=1 Tax=Actinomadura atramentaria TaxID=1990 RepID=UPI00036682D0|nr:hypothetical protein [Actinomadura atramentaria]